MHEVLKARDTEKQREKTESSSATCMTKRLTSLTPAILKPKREYVREREYIDAHAKGEVMTCKKIIKPKKRNRRASNERVCACARGKVVAKGEV